MSLNELDPGMEQTMCSTDSRLRPDIRKLEMGDQDGAAAEKIRLEEKQRDTRKARKHKKGQDYMPRYIKLDILVLLKKYILQRTLFHPSRHPRK